MAGLKGNSITAFNAGEMTPGFAGRIDKDESKFTFRYSSNFLPTCQGGLKKFYGTYLVDYIPVNVGATDVKIIPFDGASMPLAVVFFGGDVYSVSPLGAYKMGFNVPTQVINGLSYKQVNDVIYCASDTTAPFSIAYVGLVKIGHDDVPTFEYREGNFSVEPFFPLGWNGNYTGKLTASDYSGKNVTFRASRNDVVYYSLELPSKLKTVSASTGLLSRITSNATIFTSQQDGASAPGPIVIGRSILKVYRVRTDPVSGSKTTSEVISVEIGNQSNVKSYRR